MHFSTIMRPFCVQLLVLFLGFHGSAEACRRYTFEVKETPYTRLCRTKNIMTINGEFPGPTIHVHKGETIIVDVYNKADHNITVHWHGVKLPRHPWSDGPEYITQCPIQPGHKFSQKVIFSVEEGTLWWHAHSDWSRATVYGAIVIYPEKGTHYPFPKPDAEVPILLGEWWNRDVWEVYEDALRTGGDPNVSDAFTINGQPGDLYPCSRSETFKLAVEHGKTYLLRIINAALQDILFFKVANHTLTVVANDASYTKPLIADYISITPGQTMDVLLEANQPPSCTRNSFYMATRAYSSSPGVPFDNTTATAIVQYATPPHCSNINPSSSPSLPSLPYYNDTSASVNFTWRLRGLVDEDHPNTVPVNVTVPMKVTLSINTFPCASNDSSRCAGPNGTRLAASMNNVSFHNPDVAILEAYYRQIRGVYGVGFPDEPPFEFNYTADSFPPGWEVPRTGTKVKVVDYNASVEVVFQGTNLGAVDHPMHVHGTSFYVVGWGFGNFDEDKDPLNYNLVDPPLMNTVAVPKSGWTTIRFIAKNPGVWFVHCHIERHMTWGMKMAFIVKNGNTTQSRMLPPPPHMPPC